MSGHEPVWSQNRVRAILDGHDAVVGRRVAFALPGLIALSVVSTAIDTMDNLSGTVRTVLAMEEMVVATAFLLEYGARIYAAPRRLSYILSPLGIIDLLAVLPSLLALGYDVRALRALRVLRVFGLLKMVRYLKVFERLVVSIRSVGDELVIFLVVALIVLYLCATGIYYLEHEAQPEVFGSIPAAMWWAVVTLTTVGYGDAYPVTTGGRIFTGFILLLALGVISVPTGLVASALAEHRARERNVD